MTEDAAAARLAELEADNARLRRLLDQQNAPGELRHRLRSTLALLRTIIREAARAKEDVEAFAAHMEDRVDTLARAQSAADQFGEVGLAGIIVDELHHYGASEGMQVTLAGPDIFLQPRVAQVMALAIHELAVNAVEHGPLMKREGKVDVAWKVEESGAGATLSLTWKESGLPQMPEAARRGFGTAVLTEMLRYELHAVTSLDFEADGLRCTIKLPLPEPVGRAVLDRQ